MSTTQAKQTRAQNQFAPELQITQWFNTETPITLDDLRGRVVVLYAFQMLCPSCVSHSIPQASSLHSKFGSEVAVIGLHTVFEHHEAMAPYALDAFLHEYRVRFPVGVDAAALHDPIPKTMKEYGLRGTPSLILIDKAGYVRLHHFGHLTDLEVGMAIGTLVSEPGGNAIPTTSSTQVDKSNQGCGEEGCLIPQSESN